MILRCLLLMVLVVSLVVPALATPVQAKPCKSQSSIEMCHLAQPSGLTSGQARFELPCGGKALPCPMGALPDAAEREEILAFVAAPLAWPSQSFAPPEKPPRI